MLSCNLEERERDFWHSLRLLEGDTKQQALLREKFYNRRSRLREKGILDFDGPDVHGIFLNEILSKIKDGAVVADLGCGTGHLLAEICASIKKVAVISVTSVGLDLSRWMLMMSAKKFTQYQDVLLVRADVYDLPFPDSLFDISISRTSPYSAKEVPRILKEDGLFLKYDEGPSDYREICQEFGDRYTIKTPWWVRDINRWKEEEIERHRKAGFREVNLSDYRVTQYYSLRSLIMLIKMVPLVEKFSEKQDRKELNKIESRCRTQKGIAISREYFILIAKK